MKAKFFGLFASLALLGISSVATASNVPDASFSYFLEVGNNTVQQNPTASTPLSGTLNIADQTATATTTAGPPTENVSVSVAGAGKDAFAFATIKYYFQVTGGDPFNVLPVPVIISANGAVTSSNLVNQARLSFNTPYDALGQHIIGSACTTPGDASLCAPFTVAPSFSTVTHTTVGTGLINYLLLETFVHVTSPGGTASASGFIDPTTVIIDPNFEFASLYKIEFSTGISNGAAPLPATWASGAGSDANDCSSPVTPCRTLTTALSKIVPGGVMHVLPGSYDAPIVTQAVDIVAEQGTASIVGGFNHPLGGTFLAGIYVNAGPSDVVRIRGMIINERGNPYAGILFASGAALHVENCVLSGTTAGGPAALHFAPTTAASGGVPSELSVRNSTISASPGGNVLIQPSAGVAVAALFENTLMAEGLYGIRADNSAGSGMIRVDVKYSTAKGNTNNGFLAVGTGGNPIHFMIDHSTAENNGVNGAIATGAQAFMIVTDSTLMGNGTGLAQQSGATVTSTGTNTINFNTTNTSGTITPIAPK
jgi:hypothetical protein